MAIRRQQQAGGLQTPGRDDVVRRNHSPRTAVQGLDDQAVDGVAGRRRHDLGAGEAGPQREMGSVSQRRPVAAPETGW